MFMFEDIVNLDDRSVQLVLRQVEGGELALALKGVPDPVRDKITGNLSSRAAENLVEEVELLGPVRLTQVEEAQQSIIRTIRQLEEQGQIMVRRGSDDEFVRVSAVRSPAVVEGASRVPRYVRCPPRSCARGAGPASATPPCSATRSPRRRWTSSAAAPPRPRGPRATRSAGPRASAPPAPPQGGRRGGRPGERRAAAEEQRADEHRAAVAALELAALSSTRRSPDVCARVEEQATGLAWELTSELVGHELGQPSGADVVRRALRSRPTEPVVRLHLHPGGRPRHPRLWPSSPSWRTSASRWRPTRACGAATRSSRPTRACSTCGSGHRARPGAGRCWDEQR